MAPPATSVAERKGRRELAGHRVLVLYSESLMAQGVEAMLRKLSPLDTVGVDINQPDAVEQARAAQPDAVVVDVSELRGPCQALFLLLLDEFPALRIICLLPEGNAVDVFRKQRVYIRRAQDLIASLLER
jgi:DNA-binding NarL/FixJ family response regulator